MSGITVIDVTKRFNGFTALDDVSVTIPEGSLTALLGPSGSGKSTLLRVIAGLESPDGGKVLIGNEDVTEQPARARGVGMVFQHYAAFKHMTVYDNVAFGLAIRRRPRAEIRDRVHELLELVQLEGLAKRYPAQLSGGQRQRMALARASRRSSSRTTRKRRWRSPARSSSSTRVESSRSARRASSTTRRRTSS